ncbi:rhodanese-like domain-containing protein [Deinococcus sp. RM]|uniref:rhodanese-like domain-containing protein n=1 Tax=Deinococcus sp. RM TaxID=2316359 RepID=UPI000E6896BD|nr:rhodanese-like domain-containing protein [Deinococcus sp. RM]RIY02921.1 rhodanese-like domain-containing protein [Deinococcus sp. RM]
MTYTDVFPNELDFHRRAGAALIDVREPDEYVQGHVPGALNLPLSELQGRETEVPGGAVLICASGNRSSQAAAYLAGLGHQHLKNLMGGTFGWMREGRDLATGDQP